MVCGFKFNRLEHSKYHLRDQHKRTVHICTKCNRGFQTLKKLRLHEFACNKPCPGLVEVLQSSILNYNHKIKNKILMHEKFCSCLKFLVN